MTWLCSHTFASQGMVQLAMITDIEEVILFYHDNQDQHCSCRGGTEGQVFLTFNGGMYTQVYRKLQEGLSVGNMDPPVPSKYRVMPADSW